MKTISSNFLKKASELNYYTLETIPQNVLNDDWFAKSYEFKTEQFNKIIIPNELKNIDDIEVFVFAKISEQFENNFKDETIKKHELYYIDNFYILVYSKKLDLICQLMNRNGKYCFHPLYEVLNKLQYKTSYEQRKPFLNQLKEPNQIGVFTPKKVNDWLLYCIDYIAKSKECLNSINSKLIENQKIIDDTIKSLKGCEVRKYHSSTVIKTPLFTISFELLNNGSYLSQKIKYTGTINDIIKLNK